MPTFIPEQLLIPISLSKMKTFSLLAFSLLILLRVVSSTFSPSTYYYLNCGSSSNTTLNSDNPTRLFTSDSTYLASSSTSKTMSTSTPTSSPLYSSARIFTSPTSYHFPTSSSLNPTYILRLHFLPFSTPTSNLSSATFSVSALDLFILLSNFSVSDTTSPTIKEFYLPVTSDSASLTFSPAANSFAFVNAIELFSAPPNLINSSNPLPVNLFSGNPAKYIGQGLETLYRVNVGGLLVTPFNDTLWRTWLPDDRFIFRSDLSVKTNTTDSITYGSNPLQTREIAPAFVYDTARKMAVNNDTTMGNPNFDFKVTWSFNVSPGQNYFVRMHFCNFMFDPVNFMFDVYIGQSLAYRDLRPGSLTYNTPAAASFVDFATASDQTGVLNVSIGKSNLSILKERNAFLNGLEIMKLGLDPAASPDEHHKSKILVFCVVGGAVLVLLLVLVAVLLVCKRRLRKVGAQPKPSPVGSWSPYPATTSMYNSSSKSTETPRVNLDLQISFEEIRFATDDFDEKQVIGSGGFGKVYKGVLRDGTKVAVKRGTGVKQGFPEFQTEVEVLSKIRHRHLVSIVGYCEEQSEMILVYEYMEKGPLKNHLYGSNLPCLSWKQRLEICIGAARGLHYLHTGYSDNIIHRDIKSTNILLAEDYLAKVADFGLSKVGPSSGETHVSTGVKGTFGYLDPEYFKIQKLTDKSDVYSFGVMLFEVLCARPVIDPNLSRDQLNLAEWALIWQRRGQLERIIDPRLVGKVNVNSLRKFGETAEKCLADYGVDRPTIGDVLWNLEYALQLQETELRREPFEDSGNVDSQLPVNAARRIPSLTSSIGDDGHEGESTVRLIEMSSGVSESMVFSQLITGHGR